MSKVEVRKLGDIEDLGLIEMGRGNVISKNDILSTPGNYPVYSSSSSNNGEIGRYGKYMFDDERITWSIDGGGKLFYRNNVKYSVTNVCGWLKVLDEKKIISKYLYYLLINQWQKLNFNYSHKAHPSVIRNEYYVPNIEIKVQEKIVKILDSFTNLIDALNEELSLRQKQFDYYREKLLTFDKCECEWKKLGDIAEIGTGKGNTNEGLNDGLYPFFTRGQDILWKNDYEFDEEAVITAGDGVGVGKVMHYINGKYSLHQRAYRFKPTKKLVTKFLYHYMKVTFFKYVCGNSVASSVSSLRKPQLIAYPIPIPSLAIQQSIVDKLDAFESLISSLKEEIALRQKQYEYYREKLLTFD